jgi:hypothetical protein
MPSKGNKKSPVHFFGIRKQLHMKLDGRQSLSTFFGFQKTIVDRYPIAISGTAVQGHH